MASNLSVSPPQAARNISAPRRASQAALWTLAAAAMGSLLVLLPRSPLPWFDEVLMQSTALSVSRGQPAIPSVLGAFPYARSFGLFYGPVGLGLGTAEVKLFGTSLIGWRLLGWFGGLAIVLLAAWVARRITGSSIAMAATAVLAAFSQGVGARSTSGRLDTLSVAIELAAFGFFICALQSLNKPAYYLHVLFCGFFTGLAVLSTPRCFAFAIGLLVACAVGTALHRDHAPKLLAGVLIAACVIGILVLAWTVPAGSNPMDWLRYIFGASRGDRTNVSPLLGGVWHLMDGPIVERGAGLCFLLVVLLCVGNRRFLAREAAEGKSAGLDILRLAVLLAVTNYGVTFVLISRFWDYDIFVVPLLLPVVVATASELRYPGRKRSSRWVLMAGALAVWASACLLIRTGKVLTWVDSYPQRDMAPLTHFVGEHVPPGSIVFGPMDYYFYAVEGNGSRYLYARPWVSTGLGGDARRRPAWDELIPKHAVFLIWPSGSKLPEELGPDDLLLLGRFQPQAKSRSPFLATMGISGDGYPETNLYRVRKSSP